MPGERHSRGETRIESLIQKQHLILGIYVTFRCPLECSHCGVESHPRRSERIETAMVLEQIEKAARSKRIHTLHLNGGEPFLERQLLIAVSRKSLELGLEVAVTTSAHWATSLERARKVLSELPVLSQMMISTDVYHLPFVALDNVVSAARAGIERGVRSQIAICTRTGTADAFVEQVRKALGPELEEAVECIVFPLDPVGRAASLPEAHWREESESWPTGRCYQLNRPVLLPDGTLSACCNTLVTNKKPGTNPLKLGNCHQEGIGSLLGKADRSFYIQAIRIGGPALLARLAAERGASGELQKTHRCGDICDLCEDILYNPRVQEVLREAFRDPQLRKRIAFLRATTLGEREMLEQVLDPLVSVEDEAELQHTEERSLS